MRKTLLRTATALALAVAPFASVDAQLAGEPFIHDPSTVTYSDGRWWTFGTRGGGLVSDDGWTWHSGGERPGGGVAPDVVKIGDRFYVAYAVGGGGMNGGHASQVKVMWTRSLDPKSPVFGYHEVGVVAQTDGIELADAIDPAFLYAEGRLWLSYGTYFGFIRMVELDPRSGARLPGNQPVDVAIDMEATALLHRDGWYYLLGTHGTCCDGPNSSYNIRVGRARQPTGPFVDQMGVPLLMGGGKLVVAGRGRVYGPGHFGLIDLGDGVEKFSMHYEADMDRSGRSVLGIQPLRWQDGWPIAGENVTPGTYEIQSERAGTALQLAVDPVRIAFDPRRSFMAKPSDPVAPIANQTLDESRATWPVGEIEVDLGDYLIRPQQQWTVMPVEGAGGAMGAPYYRIAVAGTERVLAVAPGDRLQAVPRFTGAPEQLWRIDQLTDGSYRIMPRQQRDARAPLALVAIGRSTPALVHLDPAGHAGRWSFRAP
ncbi:family 43 glycosylhydrolase [Sphingomonas sp. DT-51]|uniref:family 43 glycosylhydrolase n=1 Tax=Sphingomonas sp. DT-51 TaxID=3396165 RepID=UPI003F199597